MADETFDVLIIGGGSGLTAAYHAEADGLDVAVVEPGPLGGTCVNRGCIPTKTLIESAKTMRTIQNAEAFNIHGATKDTTVDFPGIMQRMRSMRKNNVAHSDEWIQDSDAVTLYRDYARFTGERTVELEDAGTTISAETVFITTGARPLIPPIDGLDEVPYLTNRTIINDLNAQPTELVIIGGGYIGLEFAHFFASLGTEVTIFEGNPTVATPEDDDIRQALTEKIQNYATVHLDTFASRVEQTSKGIRVEGGDDGTVEATAGKLLVAAGRRPNTEDMGLETAGIETTERGFIKADDTFQTTVEGVYAYGDVIGRGMFKHASSFEGEIAYKNSQGANETLDYDKNPHAVFTHPPVAGVGLTERDARETGRSIRVETSGYEHVAKGSIVQAKDAFAKAIIDEDTREILGFHVIGPQAPALVHEVVVAMTAGDGTVENITDAIHVHPTLSELVHTLFNRF